MGKDTIILIGFMGSGKTSVGKALSKKLGLPVLDTDALIVEKAGKSVKRIFAEDGQEAFRQMETGVLEELKGREGRYILSVGGGLPLRAENRALLRQLGRVYYLEASVEALSRRLEGDRKRPLLRGEGSLEDRIRKILTDRQPLYEEAADQVIETDSLSIAQVAEKISCLAGSLRAS